MSRISVGYDQEAKYFRKLAQEECNASASGLHLWSRVGVYPDVDYTCKYCNKKLNPHKEAKES